MLLCLSLLALGACRGAGTDDASATEDDLSQAKADAAPLMPTSAMIERATHRDYWPDGDHDWRALSANDQAALMRKKACADYASFLFPAADADQKTAAKLGTTVDKLTQEQQALRSDGVIVVKGGTIVYESYVGPYAGHAEKKHCMWSASKSFTTGMVGAIIQSGKKDRNGQPIGLSTPMSSLSDVADARIAKLTVEDLLSMNLPSPAWNEGYDGNIKTSSVVGMLWNDGAHDMASYARKTLLGPPANGDETSFRYSSGAAVILFDALRSVYTPEEYARLPFDSLFDKLGMKSAVLERDQKGTFVGSSYAHMTLRDMARFGYTYLNGGYFGGQQVIAPAFVDKARVIGNGMIAKGTSDEAIEEEGSFYSLGFWINPNPRVLQNQGIKTFGAQFPKNETNGLKAGSKFFPNTPVDVFFAAGHYGQNILVFPKEDLLVVRMSHDNEYFSKLDRMMSGARACFGGVGQ